MYAFVQWHRRQVVPRFPADASALESLNLSDMALDGSELAGLAGAPAQQREAVKALSMAFNRLESLSPLLPLVGLKRLVVSHNALTSLAGAEALGALEFLDCSFNRVADLAPLLGCPLLGELWANNNDVSDLSCIARMPRLTRKFLHDNPVGEERDTPPEPSQSASPALDVPSPSQGCESQHNKSENDEDDGDDRGRDAGSKAGPVSFTVGGVEVAGPDAAALEGATLASICSQLDALSKSLKKKKRRR